MLRKLVMSLHLVVRTISIWSFGDWLGFWLVPNSEKRITVGSHAFIVRSTHLRDKLVDLQMIFDGLLNHAYSDDSFPIKSNETIIDVGAHIGAFTVYAATRANRGRVLSIEPNEDHFLQLNRNVKINYLTNVVPINLAIADRAEDRRFYTGHFNNAESGFFKKTDREIEVSTATLQDVFEKYKIKFCDFLKIDCEGAEYEMLYGAREVLSRVGKIAMECHRSPELKKINLEYNPASMMQYLISQGFKIDRFSKNGHNSIIWAQKS